MNTGVYKITTNINNKFYIGSAVDIDRRIKKHFRELKDNNHHSKKFQNLYNKYKHSIILNYEILEYCNISILLSREQFYIDNNNYNTLLNINKIVNSRLGLKNSIETNSKISNSLKGHIVSPETREKVRQKLTGIKLSKDRIKKHMKKINQFDLKGYHMRSWNSIKEASETLSIERGRIAYCIKNPHLNFYDSYWRNYNEKEIRIIILPSKNKRRIALLENGKVIKEFNSIKQVANELNLNSSKIVSVCKGQRKTTGGYQFQYL